MPSSSADTLQLAEYALKAYQKQRITVCPFFAPSPQSVSSQHCVLCTALCCEAAGNAGKSVPAAAIHCAERRGFVAPSTAPGPRSRLGTNII